MLVVNTFSTKPELRFLHSGRSKARVTDLQQFVERGEVTDKEVTELSVDSGTLVEPHRVDDIFDDFETDPEERHAPFMRIKTG